MNELNLADDILIGGAPIAKFLIGRSDQKAMRKLYHLTSEVPEADRLPVFRLGGQICARKTTLLNWIAEREGRAVLSPLRHRAGSLTSSAIANDRAIGAITSSTKTKPAEH